MESQWESEMCSPSCQPFIPRAALRQQQYLFVPTPGIPRCSERLAPDPEDVCTCAWLCAHVPLYRCVRRRLILGRSFLLGCWVREQASCCQVKLSSSPTGGKISYCTPGQLMFSFLTCRDHWIIRGAKSSFSTAPTLPQPCVAHQTGKFLPWVLYFCMLWSWHLVES